MANNFVPNSAILRLIWQHVGGVTGLNVLGVSKPSPTVINQALADALGTAIKSALTTSGLAITLSPLTTLQKVGIRDYSTENMVEYLDSGAAVPGTGTGDPLNPSQSHVVTLRTDRSGARYRGRVYVSGFTEAGNETDATCSQAIATATVNFISSIGTTLEANGLELAVMSRPADRTVISRTVTLPGGEEDVDTVVREARPGAITPVVTLLSRNRVWDSQRRRTKAGSGSTLFEHYLSVPTGGQLAAGSQATKSRR